MSRTLIITLLLLGSLQAALRPSATREHVPADPWLPRALVEHTADPAETPATIKRPHDDKRPNLASPDGKQLKALPALAAPLALELPPRASRDDLAARAHVRSPRTRPLVPRAPPR